MQINGLRTLTSALNERPFGGRPRGHQQDVLVRVPPRRDGAGDRHLGHGTARSSPAPTADGEGDDVEFIRGSATRHPRPGVPGERAAGELLLLAVRDDLGRNGPDPAQHRRRAGARPAEGAQAGAEDAGRQAEATSRAGCSREAGLPAGGAPTRSRRSAAPASTVDGGRLKLEWGTLRSRPAEVRSTTSCGSTSTASSGSSVSTDSGSDQVEICGMVHPRRRRQGVFSALFDGRRGGDRRPRRAPGSARRGPRLRGRRRLRPIGRAAASSTPSTAWSSPARLQP